MQFLRAVSAFLLLSLAAGADTPYQVEVKTSPVHGLFNLLESWRGEPHHGTQLARFFRARVPQDGPLEAFRELMDRSEWNTVRVPGDGDKRRRLSDVLEVMALQSHDAEDFLMRAQAVLDLEDHGRLSQAVRFADKPYRELVWNPGIERQADELRAEMEKGRFGERLRQAARLYGSDWPVDRPFWVGLVPIPLEEGQPLKGLTTFGHSDGFLEVVEVLPGQELGQSGGVVFHELCHSLWNTSRRMEELRRHMPAVAYAQLNEGLATALGNGWFQGILAGKLSEKPWYNDPIIAGYSRVLYPLLLPYLESGRTLDSAFAEQASAAFAQAFPDADSNVYSVLRSVLVITNLAEVNAGTFQNQLAGLGPMRSIFVATPVDAPRSLARRQELEDSVAVFMLSRAEVDQLKGYGWKPPQGDLSVRRTARSWEIVSIADSAAGHLAHLKTLVDRGQLKDSGD